MLTSISAKSNKKRGAASSLEGGDEIQGLGKRFCVTQCPWLDSEIFDLPNTFQHDPESSKRFSTDTSYDEGTRAALQLMVPEKLWAYLVDADGRKFVRLFKTLAAMIFKLIEFS